MIATTRPEMSVSEPTLYVAFDLGKKEWKLAMTLGSVWRRGCGPWAVAICAPWRAPCNTGGSGSGCRAKRRS